jgi:hypothetical protein
MLNVWLRPDFVFRPINHQLFNYQLFHFPLVSRLPKLSFLRKETNFSTPFNHLTINQILRQKIFINVEIRADFESQNHQTFDFIAPNRSLSKNYNVVIFSKVKNTQCLCSVSAGQISTFALTLGFPLCHLPSSICLASPAIRHSSFVIG